MKWFTGLLILALVATCAAMTWQHLRYLDLRREAMEDQQPVFHGTSFHSVTYLNAEDPDSLLDSLAALQAAAEKTDEGVWVYAGKAIFNAIQSTQITAAMGERRPWHAIVVQQFPDRPAYERYLADAEVQRALNAFPTRYEHGMQRSAAVNLLLPQMLLARKAWRGLTFAPSLLPLKPAPGAKNFPTMDMGRALLDESDGLGSDAIAIVNLMQGGSAEEEAANAQYAGRMLDLMADRAYGPMHIGTAISLNPEVQFDRAAIVYYPGRRYFSDLASSEYFQSIIGDKQLADTEAVITVPLGRALRRIRSS